MKYYHFARLQLAAMLFQFFGMLLFMLYLALIFIDFQSNSWFFNVPISFVFLGITLNFSITIWLRFKFGADYASPHSPEGMPVDPTGVWVDDETLLEPGSFVLALSQGRWHRAVVVEMRSGDRVLVHFLGWDSFWDEIHSRRKLQIYPEEPPMNRPRFPPNIDSSINES